MSKCTYQTVAAVVRQAAKGERILGVRLHRHPFHDDKYYRAGAKKGDHPESMEMTIPQALLDRELSWREVSHLFQYDEELGRTVSFTLRTNRAIYEHYWGPPAAGLNSGGKVVRFHRVPLSLSEMPNPFVATFAGHSSRF